VLVERSLGRTPIIGQVIREFLPLPDYAVDIIDAILRVYNRYGRRDNIHKARIKILVKSVGIARFSRSGRDRVGEPRRIFSTPSRLPKSSVCARSSNHRLRVVGRTSMLRGRETEFQALVSLI